MLDVYQALTRELSTGRPAVLGCIARQEGSAPRSLGSRFLVRQDGSLVGSIGGGALEAKAIEASRDIMGRDLARLIQIRLSGEDVAGTDMICGGNVDVLLQGFTENSSGRETLDAVLRLLEKGGQGVLATGPLPPADTDSTCRQILYLPDGRYFGHLDGDTEIVDLIRARADRILGTNTAAITEADVGDLLLEPLISRPTAIVFGAGHISVHLAPLLALTGFEVVVMDDRTEFANSDRFPGADRIVVSDYGDCFEKLAFTPETYAVIVTRGHLHDKTVLAGVLKRPHRYVGMIGSRRKRNMIYNALLNEGCTPEQLRGVHSPIGLDIGAETPEEIALAIAGELVKVRAEGLRMVKDWKV